MGMVSGDNKGPQADINVTPLMDVLPVLLIILIVITPTAIRGLDALVPQPPKSPDRTEANPSAIVVQVLSDKEHGVIYKIKETLLGKADIEPKLAEIFVQRRRASRPGVQSRRLRLSLKEHAPQGVS